MNDLIFKTPDGFDLFEYVENIGIELKNGLKTFNDSDNIVTVFGSARAKPGDVYYNLAERVGAELAKNGYSVMTGGGPGIMEAALKGAKESGGNTYGISILLPHEQHDNKYIDNGFLCRHLFTRKVLLIRNVKGYILVPGGYGTLDELFETLTLVATDIRDKTPIILIGVSFWQGLIDWIKTSLLKERFINEKELDLIYLTDNVEDAVKFISSYQNID